MAQSIDQLRIYKTARELQDKVYELVRHLPADKFNDLGGDLRRSSAAVSHHIVAAHRLFSYRLKLDELEAMRRQAATAQKQLVLARKFENTSELVKEYDNVMSQSWGLSNLLGAKVNQA